MSVVKQLLIASVAEVDAFAERAHLGQKRLSGRDYINHPREMRKRAEELGYGDSTQRELLLHDTVEDTKTQAQDLRSLGVPEAETQRILLLSHARGLHRRLYIPNYIVRIMESDIDASEDKLFDLEHNLDTEQLTSEALTAKPSRVEKVGVQWQALDMLMGAVEQERPESAIVHDLKDRIARGIIAINFELTPVSTLPDYNFRYLQAA